MRCSFSFAASRMPGQCLPTLYSIHHSKQSATTVQQRHVCPSFFWHLFNAAPVSIISTNIYMLHKTKFGGFRTNGSHFSPLSGGQSRNLLRRLSCAFLAIVTANCLSTSAAQVASAPGSTATPLPPNSRGIQQQARKARHAHPPAPAASGYAAADAHAASARYRRGGAPAAGITTEQIQKVRAAPPRPDLLGFG